jgi:hypothetical protein
MWGGGEKCIQSLVRKQTKRTLGRLGIGYRMMKLILKKYVSGCELKSAGSE